MNHTELNIKNAGERKGCYAASSVRGAMFHSMPVQFIFTVLLMLSSFASAQYREATPDEKNEIINRITLSAAEMKTMECDFVQTKELSFMNDNVVSEGRMFYKQTDKIRWEYVKPYRYVFSMDGKNVHMSSGDKRNKIPIKANRIFSEISNIMIGGVSGSGLINSKDFTAMFMIGASDYKIILTPLKKEVKDMFTSIQLYVNKSKSRIKTVVMTEKSGDKTTVSLNNVRINTSISDEIFNK
ncbi:MAG: outer membrane lipoprotein carrier protein LolA [Tannerella sp.]|jgi:outer membrane lipoprotein-sorting protein|nr:outer membrane lipoprotein carrier protein LolA [Tannerella sp.]